MILKQSSCHDINMVTVTTPPVEDKRRNLHWTWGRGGGGSFLVVNEILKYYHLKQYDLSRTQRQVYNNCRPRISYQGSISLTLFNISLFVLEVQGQITTVHTTSYHMLSIGHIVSP